MLQLTKIVGTGNDFLFVDARTHSEFGDRPELAKRVCNRNFGVGADGLIFVEPGERGADLRWDFYNNDGSVAEMCGNASRCLGRWAEVKLQVAKLTFDSIAGRVRTEVDGDAIVSHIEYLRLNFREIQYTNARGTGRAFFANTGVPHAVVELNTISEAKDARDTIQALRFHPDVGPRGTNVTFVAQEPAGIRTITYERGVEDFTLSCGTGVLAAAASLLRKTPGSETKPIQLSTPGGVLEVRYGPNWSGAVLKGPARHLFDVEVNEEQLG